MLNNRGKVNDETPSEGCPSIQVAIDSGTFNNQLRVRQGVKYQFRIPDRWGSQRGLEHGGIRSRRKPANFPDRRGGGCDLSRDSSRHSCREMKHQAQAELSEHPVHIKHNIQRWNTSIRNLEGLQ